MPGLTEAKDRAIMRIAWRVGFENDRVVSTVTYSQDEFERGPCSVSTLVQGVLHHGVPA